MRHVVLALCTALLTVACGSSPDGAGGAGEVTEPGPLGSWVLADGVDASGPITAPDGVRATLTIEPTSDGDHRLGGTAFCNEYGGPVVLAAGDWRLGEGLFQTEMACMPTEVLESERRFLDALVAGSAWTLEAPQLVVTGDDVELRFDPLAPVATADLVGTLWVLEGLVTGAGDDASASSPASGAARAELRLGEDDRVHVTTGCRVFEGDWTTRGDEVLFVPDFGEAPGSPDTAGCDDATLRQEDHVLSVLGDGFVAEVEGDRLTAADGALGLTYRAVGDHGDGQTFTGPREGEDCYGVVAMSTDGDGAPTPDAAMEELVTTGAGWWDPPAGVTFDGTTLLFEGRAVGEAELVQFDNGTWAVAGITVCYEPGSPLEQR